MKEILLTKGKIAVVDDDDFDFLSQWKWHCARDYAARSVLGRKLFMHHQIVGRPDGMVIDHINGNTFDNRKENLRFCDPANNTRNMRIRKDNTSGYKGVHKDGGKYRSVIYKESTQIHLGMFDSAIDAAIAYDAAARKIFGEFARTNFPAQPREADTV